jgi:deazaflavin-dependent oxidoreductase (nitroreductase family)
MRVPRQIVRIANAITKLALLTGIPRPPYTRQNALIVETVGRRSGKRHRIPVGYLDDGGHIIVVVEDGLRAQWIQNALANDNRLKVHLRGVWQEARLRMLDADPSSYLSRMNRVHAAFVRIESTTPAVVEIVPECDQKATSSPAIPGLP